MHTFSLPAAAKRNSWIPDIAQVITWAILGRCLSGFFICFDVFWHVKAGEWIWQNRQIPFYDPGFSVTETLLLWKDHEWLSQVILFSVWRLSGFLGLRLLLGLIPALIFSGVYILLRRRGVAPLAAILLVLVAANATIHHWLARPHLISYVLMLASLCLWEQIRRGRIRAIPLIFVLQGIWVNLHPSFVIQLVLAVVYFLEMVLEKGREPEFSRNFGRFALTIFGLAAAVFVNPHGVYAFQGVLSSWVVRSQIQEWQVPYFSNNPNYIYFLVYTWILAASLWKDARQVRFSEPVLYAAAVVFAAMAQRHIPVFVMITLPSFVRHVPSFWEHVSGLLAERFRGISAWFDRRNQRIHECENQFSGWKLSLLVWLICFSFVAVNFHAGAAPRLWNGINEEEYPVRASDFMEAEKSYGNIFSDYAWGGYLIFRFGGLSRVFMDGRADMHGVERLDEYYRMKQVKPDWKTLLDRYNINVVLGKNTWKLLMALLKDDAWFLAYSDEKTSVFLRKDAFSHMTGKFGSVQFIRPEEIAAKS